MEYLRNITVAKFGNIKSDYLSVLLTVMLCMNAVGITVSVAMLEEGFSYPENLGIAICVFACAGAVFLFFLLKRYLETITYKFRQIEPDKIKSISKIAKRFYIPFLLSLTVNIGFACSGALTLLITLWQESVS